MKVASICNEFVANLQFLEPVTAKNVKRTSGRGLKMRSRVSDKFRLMVVVLRSTYRAQRTLHHYKLRITAEAMALGLNVCFTFGVFIIETTFFSLVACRALSTALFVSSQFRERFSYLLRSKASDRTR